jgi:two-component system, LytTR family, response regulator
MADDALRAIIVDDEEIARRGVRQQLERHPDVKVIAECATGSQGVRVIAAHDPDIVFLDIQMPGGTGFEVVAQVGRGPRPAIIFVTAFDEYAVKAFDVNAVDYLLKPLDPTRFDEALARVRARLRSGEPGDTADGLQAVIRALIDAHPARASVRTVPVREGDKTILLRIDEVDWIEAAGNYLRIHAGRGRRTIITRATLQGFTDQVNDPRLLRVHRSSVVNTDAIADIQMAGRGLYVLGLRGGEKVETSYHYRAAVAALMKAGRASI